jgi:hypothetical protein
MACGLNGLRMNRSNPCFKASVSIPCVPSPVIAMDKILGSPGSDDPNDLETMTVGQKQVTD